MPSGPSLTFNGSYVDRVKAEHTLEPLFTRLWRQNQSPAQIVAAQQLNQQGLFPSKNGRSDFTGGEYPARIALAPTGAPGCEGLYHGAPCSTTLCCPGQTPVPMSEIVRRDSCTFCTAARQAVLRGAPAHTLVQTPRQTLSSVRGGMLNLNRQQVRQFEQEQTQKRQAALYNWQQQ